MYAKLFMIVAICVCFLVGCSGQYLGNTRICDEKLYFQIYTAWNDLSNCYLTDSTNFRVYVGKFDPALEYCDFKCENDSIFVFRKRRSAQTISGNIVEIWKFSRTELQQK